MTVDPRKQPDPPSGSGHEEHLLELLRDVVAEPNPSSCVTPEELEQWVQGDLHGPRAETVRVHVNVCDACRETYQKKKAAAETRIRLQGSDLSPRTGSSTPDPMAPAATATSHLPAIEGYQITGVLGQGGMGIVYRAIQTKLNRSVALKVLPRMLGGTDSPAVKRFRREATAAARLHHTHIVPIYEFGESSDAYYYAMELIKGLPLSTIISRLAENNAATASPSRLAELLLEAVNQSEGTGESNLGEAEDPSSGLGSSTVSRGRVYYLRVAHWMADAANALHYAHLGGIIHRDVKPANLLVATDGRIVIADFGLAKSDEDRSLTITGSFLGTLRYVSPEQAMAKRVNVDHRTDIYSLGATLYELLCFQPAFPGDEDKQILGDIIARDPVRPCKIAPNVPQELDTICMKCLEKHPTARYETARDLADDLRRYIGDLPIAAKRPSWMRRLAKFTKRHRAAVTGITAAVLLAGTAAGALWAMSALRESKVQRLVDSGLALAAESKWDQAADHFTKALELDPTHPRTLTSWARSLKEQSETVPDRLKAKSLLERAEQLCRTGLERKPNHFEAMNCLAVILRMLDRPGESVEILRRVTQQYPDFYASWTNLGAAHAAAGELTEAGRCLREGAELAGRVKPSAMEAEFVALSWRHLAAYEMHVQEPDKAWVSLENALQAYDVSSANWALRAQWHIDRGDFKKALKDVETADVYAKNEDPRVKRLKALAHLRNHDPKNAIADSEAAIELGDSLLSFPYFILALASMELQPPNAVLAREAYQRATDSWPIAFDDVSRFEVVIQKKTLWFEHARDLFALRDEARAVLNLPTSP